MATRIIPTMTNEEYEARIQTQNESSLQFESIDHSNATNIDNYDGMDESYSESVLETQECQLMGPYLLSNFDLKLIEAESKKFCTIVSSGADKYQLSKPIPLLNLKLIIMTEDLNQLNLSTGKICHDLIDVDNSKTIPALGTPEWRSLNAKNAAEARHNKPGGSREKQRLIQEAWASGKYDSRDICAEQECAALDMSISAARNALKNTPKP